MSDQPRQTVTEQDNARWLLVLCDLAQKQVQRERPLHDLQPQTGAYTDLIFAFGLARLAAHDMSKDLMRRATVALADKDQAHVLLLEAFRYRITQILEGKPHAGPLPSPLVESIETTSFLLRYIINRLRSNSHILEPDQRINPYRHWLSRINKYERPLQDGEEIVRRVEQSLQHLERDRKGNGLRVPVLRAGLNVAARVNADFGRQLLDQVLTTCDAQPNPKQSDEVVALADLLERALFIASRFKLRERIAPLVLYLRRLLALVAPETYRILNFNHTGMAVLSSSFGQCVRWLQEAGEREELGHLLKEATELILQGRELADLDPEQLSDAPDELRPLIHVASGMLSLGEFQAAEVILTAARLRLFQDAPQGKARSQWRATSQAVFATDYAKALGHASANVAKERLEELFRFVKGVRDTYATSSHYSVDQLDLIGAAVLSAVEVFSRS